MSPRAGSVANEKEVLSFVTKVLRGEEADCKMTDRLKAADMLGKRYRLFAESDEPEAERVVIVDDIGRGEADG